jgi:DNA repair exonuclease SbcCD nuclease subunit
MAKLRHPIAIAFSDLHLTEDNQYSEGKLVCESSIQVIIEIRKKARELNVPILFTGDLIHTPKTITNYILNRFLRVMPFGNRNFWYGISGNHDFCEQNTPDYHSFSHLDWVSSVNPRIMNLDWVCAEIFKGIMVWGIPYLQYNIGLVDSIQYTIAALNKNQKNILLLHTDLPNARDTDDRVVGTDDNIPENFEEILSNFDLVLCGHIHKHQKIYQNTYMVGAPIQQRLTDIDNDMGYLIIYNDMTLDFIPLKGYPTFRYYDEGDEKPDNKNYWVKRNNYKSLEKNSHDDMAFNPNKSRAKLAKKYCQTNNISSPIKRKALIQTLKNS